VCQGGLNSLNAELNSVCHLLALLGVHYILHVSRRRVKGKSLVIIRACVDTLNVIYQLEVWAVLDRKTFEIFERFTKSLYVTITNGKDLFN